MTERPDKTYVRVLGFAIRVLTRRFDAIYISRYKDSHQKVARLAMEISERTLFMLFVGASRGLAGVALVGVVGWLGSGLWALKAAGLTGTAPSGSSAITQLVATLTSNWEWLIGTGVGLVLMLIAGLMMFGSQRAPDHLFRVIGAIMLILIVIPAVLA